MIDSFPSRHTKESGKFRYLKTSAPPDTAVEANSSAGQSNCESATILAAIEKREGAEDGEVQLVYWKRAAERSWEKMSNEKWSIKRRQEDLRCSFDNGERRER